MWDTQFRSDCVGKQQLLAILRRRQKAAVCSFDGYKWSVMKKTKCKMVGRVPNNENREDEGTAGFSCYACL